MISLRRSIVECGIAALGCGLVLATFIVSITHHGPREELVVPTLWGLAVLAAFAGWGSLLARFCWPAANVALPLRAVWGASAVAAVGGVLACIGIVSRVALYGAIGGGCLALMFAIVRDRAAIVDAIGESWLAAKRSPALFGAVLFLGAVVLLHYVGGGADTTSNPYDDDVSYYPSAKQLLERGSLIEPFSFRRMSALGGQSFFHAILLLRVPVLHLNLFDRGMCFVLAVLLLASHRVGEAKVPILARLLSVAVLVILPNTSINAASYYSGLAFFLALFQTMERMKDDLALDIRDAARRIVPLALTAAAICTLRQNYQITVFVFVVVAYAFAMSDRRNGRLLQRFIEPMSACFLTALFVAPWLILLLRSNGTFLFPIMPGNFRAAVAMNPEGMDLATRLRFFIDVWLGLEPIRTLPLFFVVGLSLRNEIARKPIVSSWIACIVGLALITWNFSLADAPNLSRYSYGFLTAAALLTWQTVALRVVRRLEATSMPGFNASLQAVLLGFGLCLPLYGHDEWTRRVLFARVDDVAELWRRSVPPQVESPLAAPYHRLQSALPPSARMLILVDRPYNFDFKRNEIWNLDMPGSASPPPGIPCFQGSAPVAEYFRSKGIRYVAYVESSRSIWLYRREIWLDHLWDRLEIWRRFSPYMVDVMDNLADLGRNYRHLHDEAGMVLLDLEAPK